MRSPARNTTSPLRLARRAGMCVLAVALAAPALAQGPPDPHGAAMSAPLFVPDLPVGTISVRLARPSMSEAIAGVEVVGIWTTPDGKPGFQTARSGDDGRALFANMPVGATFRARTKVDGRSLETSEFEVPGAGGTRLLVIVGQDADDAMGDMTGPGPHGSAPAGTVPGVHASKMETNAKLPAGTIEIKVLTSDGKPIPGARVSLAQAQAKGGGIDLKHADTDDTGVARFGGLGRGPGGPWAAVVERDGLRVGTELFTLDAQHGSSGELRIPQKTSDLSVLRLAASSRLMIEPREESLALLQSLVLENGSDKAFAPGPRGLLVPLPDGCTDAEKLAGGVDVEIKEGAGAILRGIVPPTKTATAALQVQVACVLPRHDDSQVEIVQPMPLGLQGGLVMMPAMLSIGLAAPGLRALPPERDENGNDLRLYELASVPPGQPLRLTVTGLPRRPRAGKWVAGVLATLLVAAGVVALRRPRRGQPTAKG